SPVDRRARPAPIARRMPDGRAPQGGCRSATGADWVAAQSAQNGKWSSRRTGRARLTRQLLRIYSRFVALSAAFRTFKPGERTEAACLQESTLEQHQTFPTTARRLP